MLISLIIRIYRIFNINNFLISVYEKFGFIKIFELIRGPKKIYKRINNKYIHEKTVYISVRPNNRKILNLYEKVGFNRIDQTIQDSSDLKLQLK